VTVTGVDHFALTVPDLDAAAKFYAAFGLETSETSRGSIGARCPGRPHDEIDLIEGTSKRLHHVGFRTTDDGLAELRTRLAASGTVIDDEPPAGGEPVGIWFRDPHDVWVNVRVADPPAPAPFGAEPSNAGDARLRVDTAAWTTYDPNPRPRQLGHFLIFTPDIYASEAWYVENLGFVVSDRSLGKGHFLRAGDGFHHVFGFIGGSRHNGLHHVSFEMAGVDEIMLGTSRMREHGHDEVWGLGRHTIGSNLFSYIRDPWGSWCEYFADMDLVTSAWQPSDVEAPPHVWAPPMEADFFPRKFFYNAEGEGR
jgi:catechol 2,3-dioxygenase-like lactoylglutathione lyase family enzyme